LRNIGGVSGGTTIDRHVAAPLDRVSGSLVDLAVIAVLGAVSFVAVGGLAGHVIGGVAAFVYLTMPVALWGRTLGKVIANTRVVRARDGKRPTLGQAFERTALLVTPTLITLVTLPYVHSYARLYIFLTTSVAAGIYTSALTREDLAGWHDVYAQTVVVRSQPNR
jgi:uncharacterized RDD family membrane protein YckC